MIIQFNNINYLIIDILIIIEYIKKQFDRIYGKLDVFIKFNVLKTGNNMIRNIELK